MPVPGQSSMEYLASAVTSSHSERENDENEREEKSRKNNIWLCATSDSDNYIVCFNEKIDWVSSARFHLLLRHCESLPSFYHTNDKIIGVESSTMSDKRRTNWLDSHSISQQTMSFICAENKINSFHFHRQFKCVHIATTYKNRVESHRLID